jgi:hypothetical protein
MVPKQRACLQIVRFPFWRNAMATARDVTKKLGLMHVAAAVICVKRQPLGLYAAHGL